MRVSEYNSSALETCWKPVPNSVEFKTGLRQTWRLCDYFEKKTNDEHVQNSSDRMDNKPRTTANVSRLFGDVLVNAVHRLVAVMIVTREHLKTVINLN